MVKDAQEFTPAAFSVPRAVQYSGLTRTYIYSHRHLLDWRKAGRRSLITRTSLDALIAALPRASPLPGALSLLSTITANSKRGEYNE